MVGLSVPEVALVAALLALVQGAPPNQLQRFPQQTEEILRYGQNLTVSFTPHTPNGILSVAFGSDEGALVYNFIGRRENDVCVLIFSTGMVASAVDKIGELLSPLAPLLQEVGEVEGQENLYALRVVSELLQPSQNQTTIMRKYGWTHPSINTTQTKFVGFVDNCKDSNEIKWHSLDSANELKIVSAGNKLTYEMPGVDDKQLKELEIELDDNDLSTPFVYMIGAGPGTSLGQVKKQYASVSKDESLE